MHFRDYILYLFLWASVCGCNQGQDTVKTRILRQKTIQELTLYVEATRLCLTDCTNRTLIVSNLPGSLVNNPGVANWKGPYLKGSFSDVDAYGTRIRFSLVNGQQLLSARSAGADGQFETDDDLEVTGKVSL